MGAPRTTPKVLEGLRAKPGEWVTLAQLIAATGLTEKQIVDAIYNLRQRHGYVIDAEPGGRAFQLRHAPRQARVTVPPAKAPAGKRQHRPQLGSLFECVGTTAQDQIVIRDEYGRTYTAVPQQ